MPVERATAKSKTGPGWWVSTRTMLVGALGGGLAFLAGIPLGWLIGAMAITTVLAMSGVSMRTSPRPRATMIVVIGLMVGSAFSPEVAARTPEWIASLFGVLVYVAIVAAFGVFICLRWGRLEPATAAFSGMPGGLSEMVVIGPALGADVRSVSLVHGTRLLVLIAVIPTVLSSLGLVAVAGGPARTLDLGFHLSLFDLLILTACGVGGSFLGKALRFPAAMLTGPLLLSAIVHITGLTSAHIPGLVLALAQVVIGASIGQHFAGVERKVLATGFALGAALTVFSLVLATGFALVFERALGVPFAIGLFALVPGGLPEMSLMAISLDADPAFVSLHHLFRMVLILTFAPLLIPRWVRRMAARQKAQ